MKKQIFKNKIDADFYNSDGFVKPKTPFLDEDQLNRLKELANSIDIPKGFPFYSTTFIEDLDFKKEFSQKIIDTIQPQVNEYFSDYKLLGGNFLYKLPGKEGEMPVHQDWTVVDEKEFAAITIWVPLCDTSFENGAFHCIPGSHNWPGKLRAPSLPVSFENVKKELNNALQLQPLAAGEAIMFDHSIMHASPPNMSDQVRIALTIGLVHKDTQMKMYYAQGKGKVAEYDMPDDMFINFPAIKPKPKIGKLVRTFDYQVPQYTQKEIFRLLYEYRKDNFRMKKIFKDPEKQEFYEKNGYLKVNALNKSQVDELLGLLKELDIKDDAGVGFYVGMDSRDKKKVAYMMDKLIEVAFPPVQEHMFEAKVFVASFAIKDPNPKCIVPPHQDWSFVENEHKHTSLTLWIPLLDVNVDNGCISVIQGSNRFFMNVRPSPSPQVHSPLSKHVFSLFPYMKPIEMKAGEALLFDNRTIHASTPNLTDKPRIAIGLGITQKEAKVRHFNLKPNTTDRMLTYKVDGAFFRKYDNGMISRMYEAGEYIEGYNLIKESDLVLEDVTTEEMNKRVLEAGNVVNEELVQHMSELFKDEMQQVKEEEESEEMHVDGKGSLIYRLRPSNLVSAFKYYVMNQR